MKPRKTPTSPNERPRRNFGDIAAEYQAAPSDALISEACEHFRRVVRLVVKRRWTRERGWRWDERHDLTSTVLLGLCQRMGYLLRHYRPEKGRPINYMLRIVYLHLTKLGRTLIAERQRYLPNEHARVWTIPDRGESPWEPVMRRDERCVLLRQARRRLQDFRFPGCESALRRMLYSYVRRGVEEARHFPTRVAADAALYLLRSVVQSW